MDAGTALAHASEVTGIALGKALVEERYLVYVGATEACPRVVIGAVSWLAILDRRITAVADTGVG